MVAAATAATLEARLAALEHQAKDLPVVLAVQAEDLLAAAAVVGAQARLVLTVQTPTAAMAALELHLP